MNSNSWASSNVEEHIAAFKQPPTYNAYKTPAKLNKPPDPFDKLTHLTSDVEEAMNMSRLKMLLNSSLSMSMNLRML